jgi:hypothetical protein
MCVVADFRVCVRCFAGVLGGMSQSAYLVPTSCSQLAVNSNYTAQRELYCLVLALSEGLMLLLTIHPVPRVCDGLTYALLTCMHCRCPPLAL